MVRAKAMLRSLQPRFAVSDPKNASTFEEQKATQALDNGVPAIDKKKERQLVRKLDRYIIPVVMLLYLLSFLDRYHPKASMGYEF